MTIPRRRFRAIGASIEKIVKPILGHRGFGVATIVNGWADIVGPLLAKHTFPEQISYPRGSRLDGTLNLRIDNSAMALELQHLAPQLQEKINIHFGYRAISRIKILQGPVPELRVKEKVHKRSLNNDEKEQLGQKLDIVSDPDLKAALSALGSSIIENKSND